MSNIKNILLVIDLQPEFADKSGKNYNKILQFIKDNRNNYDFIIATKFISGNENFPKCLNWSFQEFENTKKLKNGIEFEVDQIIAKSGYGLKDYGVLEKEDCHYDIIGCEIDACVYKIAMDMFDREYNFSVLISYCYTKESIKNIALKVLERNLGAVIRKDVF